MRDACKETGQMNATIRSSDIRELAENPILIQRAGTTVLSGTGAFIAQISTLRELANAPDAARQLGDFVEALTEQENLYAMAILDAEVTGIKNILRYIPVPGGQHGPRVKVAIDPPDAISEGGTEATVPFDKEKPAIGPISSTLERQVRAFIDLNRPVLMDYWNLKIATNKFIAGLTPITP